MRSPAHGRRLQRLWEQRFAETPFDCGRSLEPGIDEVPEWRDWSEIETTADQMRIEAALDRLGVEGRAILHVGAGNSKLAQRFAPRAAYILGTTITEEERRRGAALAIANYDIVRHNKYAAERVRGRRRRFDFIVDNNPTTFCCCWRHLTTMMDHYAHLLTPKGRLLTDRVGLAWVTSDPAANRRWSCSYEDFQAIGAAFGLQAGRLDDFVFSLTPRSRLGAAARRLRRWARRLRRMSGAGL